MCVYIYIYIFIALMVVHLVLHAGRLLLALPVPGDGGPRPGREYVVCYCCLREHCGCCMFVVTASMLYLCMCWFMYLLYCVLLCVDCFSRPGEKCARAHGESFLHGAGLARYYYYYYYYYYYHYYHEHYYYYYDY